MSSDRGVMGWEFLDLGSANLIAWTEDPEFRDKWLDEVKAGEWGDVGVASVAADGMIVERLWPLEGEDD